MDEHEQAEHDRVHAKLVGMNLLFLSADDRHYFVVYTQKGKTKLGTFNKDLLYYDRYGIDVLSTFNGRTYWFRSSAIADEISDDVRTTMSLVHSGMHSLTPFNISLLGQLKS